MPNSEPNSTEPEDRPAPERFDRYGKYLSVQAASWMVAMEPHADFLARLPPRHRLTPGRDRPSPKENGHASALSLMAVLLLDALANLAAYMLYELGPLAELTGTKRVARPVRDNLEFILDLMAQHPPAQPTADGVKEIYALRGVLAHNYVWLVEFAERDEPPTMVVRSAKLTDAFGNVLFAGVVDGLVSRSLRLNFVPDLINRVDASTVLLEVWRTIFFLSKVRGASVSADGLGHLRVAGRSMRLPDVVHAMRASAGPAESDDPASSASR